MWALKRIGPAALAMMASLTVASAAHAASVEQPTPTPSATDTGTGTPSPPSATDTGTPTASPTTPSATDTGTPTASPTTTMTSQDAQFLQLIHQANLAEVQAGNLAKQRGQNADVKDLGQMFVTDHTQLDQAVQQAARTSGVTLPAAPTAAQQAALGRLRAVSGADFDELWVTTELGWQLQSLALINTELSDGSDQTVTQLAQRAQPTIQRHLDELRALAQSMGIPIPAPTVTPGGTGSPTGTATPGGPGTSTPSTPSTPATPGGTATMETPSPTGS